MNKKPSFLNGYRYLFRNAKAGWDKYGGKICTIAGTTGLFLSGVHACRTTYKHHDDLKRYGEDIRASRARVDGETKPQRYFRIGKEVGKASLKTAKHYLPDIIAASMSSYMTSKGWGIEHNHYEQAATMVGVLAADFMNYRKNVIHDHGIEADRKYMTRRRSDQKIYEAELEDGTKIVSEKSEGSDGEGFSISVDPSMLKIWYSKETTPQVWSESHVLRLAHLNNIQNNCDIDLIYGGSISVNDIRRQFYGKKGDVACGGMFGRIWDPANPEHPERGRMVNLHFEDDQDFMEGRTDSCWIIIDIDDEPLFESMNAKNKRDLYESMKNGLG